MNQVYERVADGVGGMGNVGCGEGGGDGAGGDEGEVQAEDHATPNDDKGDYDSLISQRRHWVVAHPVCLSGHPKGRLYPPSQGKLHPEAAGYSGMDSGGKSPAIHQQVDLQRLDAQLVR